MSIEISEVNAGGGFSWVPQDINEVVPSQPVNVTADPNATAQGGVFKGITDFVGGLAGLFDNGVNIYKSVAGQYAAAEQIAKETKSASAANPKVIVTSGPSSLLSKDNLVKIGLVAGIGIIALILIRKV